MKRVVLYMVLALAGISCWRKDQVPKGILSKKEMTEVMNDMLLAESYAESYVFTDSTKNKDSSLYREADRVLAIHKVSQAAFMKSFDYYKARPDQFKVIIDTLNSRTLRNKDRIYDSERRKHLE